MAVSLPITGEEFVEDIVQQYPQAVGFLTERGIRCLMCGEPFWGRLKELVTDVGGDETRFAAILEELNAFLSSSERA